MSLRSIAKRLEELEKKMGGNLPLVIAEYANGERIEYKGLPPMEYFFRESNPIARTYGSDFADMVNVIIHPVPNRNIEDFERSDIEEQEGTNQGDFNYCAAK